MLCCQTHCGFLLVDHNDRTDNYTILGCVTGRQIISDKANSRLGNLWSIIPNSRKLLEEQEMSLQKKIVMLVTFSWNSQKINYVF